MNWLDRKEGGGGGGDLLNQIEYHPLTLLHELIKTI
jgi:hypothetical protein